MQKKSQVKMFETIAVIIVFFFILVFGLVYYSSTQQREIRKMNEEDRQLKVIETMKIVTYLPELQCSKDNVITTNCIEVSKLDSFVDLTNKNRLYYTSMFSFGNISVRLIYPDPKREGLKEEYNLYFNDRTKTTDTVSNFIPVSIYDSIDRKYYAGVLVVELYQ